MGTEATSNNNETTQQQPTHQETATAQPPTREPQPQQGAPAQTEQQPQQRTETQPQGGSGGDRFQLTKEQLDDRLERGRREARRQALMETFGTDDPEAIKKIREENDRFKQQEEERRRQEMTETERLKNDLEKEKRLRRVTETQLSRMRREQAQSKQATIVRGHAEKFISSEYIEEATDAFRRHVRSLDKDDVKKLGGKDVEKFFRTYASKKPAMALRRRVRTTQRTTPAGGGGQQRQPADGAGASDDSKKPQTNQSPATKPRNVREMSKDEWRKYKRDNGISY